MEKFSVKTKLNSVNDAYRSILQIGTLSLFLLIWLIFSRIEDYRGILMKQSGYLITNGVVISSRVVDQRKAWHYSIIYEYSIGGKNYQSDKISFASTGKRFIWEAQAISDQYPVGKKVQVYYYATDPSFAVLNPNMFELDIVILPAILLLATVFCFGIYLRMRFYK